MSEQHSPDPAPLDPLEAVAARLAAAFEGGDAGAIAAAMAAVAQSPGLPHLAAAAGIPSAQLAAAFRQGELDLDTLLAVMKVIDLHMPG